MENKEAIKLLLNRENEISGKFHHCVEEIMRGKDVHREIDLLIGSVQYALEEIERISRL